MQTPYEVVHNAVHFTGPDRLPLEMSVFGASDTKLVMWNQPAAGDLTRRQSYDEWGCLWTRTDQKNFGQVTGHPLDDWGKLDSFAWPDPDNPALYEGMEKGFENSEGLYVKTAIWQFLFERIHMLRGFENALMDFYLYRDEIEYLADRIIDYNISIVNNIASRFPGMIHGFTTTDDWGTEQALIISAELWDEFFAPRYKRFIDVCKGNGWDMWLHSCGRINDIIGSLIEVGVDVLNLQQPTTNGIAEIGSRFAGRIAFESLCDIQHTLPFKPDDEIADEARALIEHWGTDDGGFILADYGDGDAIGVDDSKKRVMFDAFLKNDKWSRHSHETIRE